MQFLVFHLGKDRYGLSTGRLTRVLPLMELKQLPGAPGYVAGLMNFHGAPVPVIDLCALSGGDMCAPHFDTRILLVDYRANEVRHRLGLIVERVTGVAKIDTAAFTDTDVAMGNAPFLGKVAAEDGSLLQLVDIEHLLTADARAILFPAGGEAS